MTKICLVCSSGGHLFQLYSLKEFWMDKEHFWVTFPTQDATFLLEEEKKHWAHYPTNRNIKNLVKNFIMAWSVLRKERPCLVMSTGAGVGVPFIIIGRILKIKTVYLESITRNEELSMSARLVYPFVDTLLVQWQDLAVKYTKAQYQGQVI